jgi:hypothetical protein
MDTRFYPQGKTSWYSKYVAGVLKFFRRSDHSEFYAIDGDNKRVIVADHVRNYRGRHTVAALNAGATFLAAIPGYKYRIVDWTVIAYGGAVGTATSFEIEGTQTSGVDLVSIAAAQLTQSAVNDKGGTVTVLADGASFVANDANTAITGSFTGTADTATGLDVIISYVIEAA